MAQREFNEENEEITRKAYELYAKYGFKDGNDFIDWLETGRQAGRRRRLVQRKQTRNILLSIVAMLCSIIIILLIMLAKYSSKMELSAKNLSDMRVTMLVLDQKADEEIVALGDTHFDYDEFALTNEAKMLLDQDVLVLQENPKMKVRMAGYTSASGTKEYNQELSERRANAVRDYMIEKGIAKERMTIVGYGMTKPALYEVSPGDINTKEARANMRVLFEIIVQ